MNTFFKKRLHRRWAWISSNGVTKNEIDYIITDKPHTFTGVSVINSFNTGSDHRMIRGSMTINTRLERARLIKRPSKANAVALSAKAAEYQLLLTNKFEALNSAPTDDIDTYCVSITSSIKEAALNTAGKDKARRPDKLSLVTKQLQEKRRQIKRNGTDVQHIEYTEICKATRSQMSEDINNYNEEQLIKSLEDNKCIKTIKRKQCLGRSNVISLNEENGTHIHDQDMMIKRCEEFYTNLYSTKLPQGQPSVHIQRDTLNTPPPPILQTEVSEAVKRLK